MKYNIHMNPRKYDTIASTVKKQITAHVQKNCPASYKDSDTKILNCCRYLDGIHCVAIDSEYSYMEKGRSICRVFNTLLPMEPCSDYSILKACAYCRCIFVARSNRQKYCPDCKAAGNREKARKRQQKHRSHETHAA